MSKVRQLLRRGAARRPAQADEEGHEVETPDIVGGVLDTYRIPSNAGPDSSAEVFVVDDDGVGKYLVRFPKMTPDEEKALELLRANLLDAIPVDAAGTPREVVADYIWRSAEGAGLGVTQSSHDKLLYYLMRDFAGFWEVDPLVNDDNLEEISVTRHDKPVRVLHRDFSEYMFIISVWSTGTSILLGSR